MGSEFVVPTETTIHQKKIQEALAKEQEILANAENNARKILEQAKVDAEALIEQARAQALSEVDAIKSQAHNEGFEAGRQEGYEDITQELTDRVESINTFAKSNFDIKGNIIKSAYQDIIDLVVHIAHKVCSKSLELDDEVLIEITQKAINSLKDKENITIIVNPQMAQQIYAISDELRERIPQLESIKIIEDNSVSPDGTIVETPLSRVDSRISSQIDEISEQLFAKLNSTSNEELSND